MGEEIESLDDTEQPDCRFCGDPVDQLEPGHYKTPGDQFAHRDCVADHCYEHREKVATDEGVFRIRSVTIMKTVGNKEELLESYWQAECPVCYQTHETGDHSEDVRTDLIDEVCECCGAEWLPPSDWIEDCEICGTSHRESRDCKPLSMREPFPDPDQHRYECSECDWSGEGDEFGNPDGYCPECDSAAVRALKITTDGGQVSNDTERSESGDRSPISDVSCPACGSEIFELKAVDEWANGDLSIYCYCAECGNATGKMWNRTVDDRITETDRSTGGDA